MSARCCRPTGVAMRYATGLIGMRHQRRGMAVMSIAVRRIDFDFAWLAGIALLAALALGLAAPRSAGAATCTKAISGPNDPGYASAERNFPAPETWNSEEWPLFDCIPQTAPSATDPE